MVPGGRLGQRSCRPLPGGKAKETTAQVEKWPSEGPGLCLLAVVLKSQAFLEDKTKLFCLR